MSAEERKTRAKTLYDDYVSTISPCEVIFVASVERGAL